MDIEVQNMDLEHSKTSFEVKKSIFQMCLNTKMTFKHIREYSRVIAAWIPSYFKEQSMEIDENQENIDFNRESPLGGLL